MNDHSWDTIVVGGGAAGLSAAQALGRSLRRTLVIDSGSARNRFAARMHNVLGHDGVPPAELYRRGRDEAQSYGVEFADGSVREATENDGALRIELDDGTIHATRALVVASGVRDELPPIPGLSERWGSSALHCPYCHGWEVRGRRIGVIATSPLSAHQAKLLRQWTDDLTVFTHGLREVDGTVDPELRRVLLARDVELIDEAVVEIVGDGTSISEVRTADGAAHRIDAVFTAGALRPRDGFLDSLGLTRSETPVGSFIAVDGTQRTSHPRIWAAGNVVAPMATVPLAMGAGGIAGAAVNFALVEEEFTQAAAARPLT